jgi:prepilin-type processing-associated H-X9-DG protein
MNWANPGFTWNSGAHVTFRNTADLARGSPSQLLTFVEAAPGHVCLPAFVVGLGWLNGCFYHLPSAQHDPFGMVAFADGHVENHRWVEPETLALARTNWLPDHLSLWLYGNRDLLWLQQHATVPLASPAAF